MSIRNAAIMLRGLLDQTEAARMTKMEAIRQLGNDIAGLLLPGETNEAIALADAFEAGQRRMNDQFVRILQRLDALADQQEREGGE